jgi:hypothetical protein
VFESCPDPRIALSGLDTLVTQESGDLLEVVVLFIDFHRHAMTQIVGLV